MTLFQDDVLKTKDGGLVTDTEKDILKGVTFERYGRGKGFGLGLIRGFGLKKGAIAGSIGQDSQNMVSVGVTDDDIALAVNEVTKMQGGVVLVADGKVMARISMPIFGIMSSKSFVDLEGDFLNLQREYENLGGQLADVVFTLSLLLTLVVIPECGLSNRGVVNVAGGHFVDTVVR